MLRNSRNHHLSFQCHALNLTFPIAHLHLDYNTPFSSLHLAIFIAA